MKAILRKLTPNFLLNLYHLFLAWLGAVIYNQPSTKIKVIGVTGTKGKSSVVYLAGKILEEFGYKVGWISSLSIKIGPDEKLNPYHLTMPGRLFIQKTLAKMVEAGCHYALVEVTSEGIKQFRHKFINFEGAVFTNLAEEHLEAHGGFENYKKAKGQLWQTLNPKNSFSIINLDDQNSDYFWQFEANKKIGYGLNQVKSIRNFVSVKNYQTNRSGLVFDYKNHVFQLQLLGKFNIYNSLAAIALAENEGIKIEVIKTALEKIKFIAGRMEEINQGQSFRVFVDLAHTPDSFEQVFKLAKDLPHQRILSLFGSAGGGRDKWKRPKLGSIAAQYSDYIVLTNEDPYDEKPEQIISEIAAGIKKDFNLEKIVDRRKAIHQILKKARSNDIVLILGKGTEATLVIGQQKIAWDDREVVKQELSQILNK